MTGPARNCLQKRGQLQIFVSNIRTPAMCRKQPSESNPSHTPGPTPIPPPVAAPAAPTKSAVTFMCCGDGSPVFDSQNRSMQSTLRRGSILSGGSLLARTAHLSGGLRRDDWASLFAGRRLRMVVGWQVRIDYGLRCFLRKASRLASLPQKQKHRDLRRSYKNRGHRGCRRSHQNEKLRGLRRSHKIKSIATCVAPTKAGASRFPSSTKTATLWSRTIPNVTSPDVFPTCAPGCGGACRGGVRFRKC
jgi:hypothetical protein